MLLALVVGCGSPPHAAAAEEASLALPAELEPGERGPQREWAVATEASATARHDFESTAEDAAFNDLSVEHTEALGSEDVPPREVAPAVPTTSGPVHVGLGEWAGAAGIQVRLHSCRFDACIDHYFQADPGWTFLVADFTLRNVAHRIEGTNSGP